MGPWRFTASISLGPRVWDLAREAELIAVVVAINSMFGIVCS